MGGAAPWKVLLVEDQDSDAELAKHYLGEHEVTHARTLAAAIEAASGASFDVALLDLSLPDGRGPPLVARLAAAAPQLPIVVLSGSMGEEYARAALARGAQDWLAKDGLDSDRMIRTLGYAIERKAFERKLSESDERFRQLADNTSSLFWVMAADLSKVIYVNSAYDRLVGSNRERLYTDPTEWSRLIHPEDRERMTENLTALASGTAPLDTRFRILRPDNVVRWLHIVGFTIRDARGEIYRIGGTIEDVTPLWESEQKLDATNRRLASILETAGEGIFGLDAKGRVTFANPAAAQLLGFDAAWLVGKDAHATFHARERDGTPRALPTSIMHRALVEAKQVRTDDDVFWRSDGAPLDVSVVATPKVEHGAVASAVVVFADVTERRRAQAALERAKADVDAANRRLEELQQFRVQLFNNIAHDMGTPLMVMGLRLDSLASQPAAPDGSRSIDARAFDALRASAEQVATLTRDLRDVSLMQAGAFRLHMRELDLAEPARRTVEQLADLAASAHVTLRAELPDETLAVRGDKTRLVQAMINLLSNAIKFSPPGGTVVLSCSKADGLVRLEVRDSGPGIPPEARARLFRPFSQVHADTQVKKGTGLGLYIVRGIMEAHGGTADIVDAPPGAGATFRLSLPAAPAANAGASAPEAGPAHRADPPRPPTPDPLLRGA